MSTLKKAQKVTPFLWFNGRAEEAMNFYTSIFPNSKITLLEHWGEGSPFPAEQVMTGSFELDGVAFHAFDAGPEFAFTEAISLFVSCNNQEEVDYYWEKLSEGGSEGPCGWLKDKFGLSWQIVPEMITEKVTSGEKSSLQNMMQALSQMKKLDIATLEEAYNQ